MSSRVVVVGAGLAGLRTVERLRRGGFDGVLTLVGAEPHLPYDRPPLSKALLASAEEPVAPVLRSAERLAELDLDLRLGQSAVGLDPTACTLELAGGEELGYDQLVLATGLVARTVPAWAGTAGVHTLRTFDDCLALRAAAATARHATVVGAGVLGAEVAATLRTRGLDVALVDPLPQPLVRAVGPEVGAFVAGLHRARGVALHLGRSVAALEESDGHVDGVTLDDGTSWATDLVVVAVGGAPDTDWLVDSGLELDGGVVVDRRGAASLPGVWAVGDLAVHAHPRGDGRVRLEHWTAAGDQAATVATNVLAAAGTTDPADHTELPYLWSDQYDTKVQCLGLPRAGDEVQVLAGSFDDGAFLVAYLDDGRVRAVAGAGMPAALMRCRGAVADAVPLSDLQDAAPWERRRKVQA